MIVLRYVALIGVAAAALASRTRAEESNAWPFYVGQTDEKGDLRSWTGLGPFLFSQPEGANRIQGFRPFYLRRATTGRDTPETDVLYPGFRYRSYGPNSEWSILSLINHFGRKKGEPLKPSTDEEDFDLWPFYFSSVTSDPAVSYHAVFPLGGTVLHRFSRDRITWALWPLYLRTEKNGAVTTSTPYPFIRVTAGRAHGFALWPLFGWNEWPGAYRKEFYLWPLGWNNVIQPPADAPAGTEPTRQQGFLPFYSYDIGPGSVNRNFVWPLFGYTDRASPSRYHETRYLWPFLVQGEGDRRLIDRWAPFYTHSVIKGYDKTWVLWPLWRQGRWSEEGVSQVKTQVLFFFYWGLVQHSLSNPNAAPAKKIHVWPLFSLWDNGAGQVQYQVLSPTEVFFPHNESARALWSPLFAIWRYDQQAPGETHASFLWDAVSWRKSEARNRSEFHLGPLLGVQRSPYGRRVSLFHGLFGWTKGPADSGWHGFWLEFSGRRATVPSVSH